MNITIVSHSYLEPENRKNVVALSELANVRAVVPTKGPVLIFLKYSFKHDDMSRGLFRLERPFWISYSDYIFLSFDMGFRKFKPDIINVEYNPWSLMFLQCLIYRAVFCRQAKIVCTIKKNTFVTSKSFKGWLKAKLARWTLKQTDFVVAGSEMVRRMLADNLKYPAEQMDVSHHLGVDTTLFFPPEQKADDGNIILGYTGRFAEEKGVLDLIEAARLCRQRDQLPIELRLLGQGELGPRLEKMAASENWLKVLPPVPNAEVANFLRHLDIFAMPSHIVYDHEEHDAHALMEALSCGVVSIGCRSGIIPELLGDGTGLLIEPENIGALAESIRKLCQDADGRRKLGVSSRAKAEAEFSLKAVAEQRLKIFRKIVHER